MQLDPFRVYVPATSANLGPGFDAVGIALSLGLRADVRPARRFSLAFAGERQPTHDGYARAIRSAIERANGALPRISMNVHNNIPLGKGLGSSAAAAVLGLAVAQRCAGKRFDASSIAANASAIEGHPDNAFAAVYGGAVIAASSSRLLFPPPRDLRALLVVPDVTLSTQEARSLLPLQYSREDMAFTAARASLLGAALASGEWHVLREAMCDRIHQPYRAKNIPGLIDALALRVRGLIGIALSGAGPAVLALVQTAAAASIGERIRGCFAKAGVDAEILSVAFAARGTSVRGA